MKAFPIKKARRVVLFLALVLFCASWFSSRSEGNRELPELPRLVIENSLPAVRDAIQKAYAETIALPQDPTANGKLGMVLQAHGLIEEAAICYQRARLLSPASFVWAYYLGSAQAARGKYDEAAVTLRQALRLDPGYLPAHMKLAECLLSTAHWEESGKIYEAAARQYPDLAAAHYGLGRVQAARKDWNGALKAYNKACELFREYGAAHYALALAYRNLGQTDKSKEQFNLYEKYKMGAPPLGDRLLAEVNALNMGAAHQIRLGKELEEAGQLEQAAAAHERALEIDPQLVQAHVNLISLYGRLGQIDKAKEHYQAAVQLNPNQAESYYNYGVLLFGQHQYLQAGETFRKTLEINPYYAEAHNNLAVLLEQQGNLTEAIGHYRKAIENKPDYRLAHFHLGRILVNQKNYPEGIEHLSKTLQPEDENTPTYLYALGAAHGRAGDRQNALRYIRMARDQAIARGQSQLLVSIEKDLQALKEQGASR